MSIGLVRLDGPNFWEFPLTGKPSLNFSIFQDYFTYPAAVGSWVWQGIVDRIQTKSSLRIEIEKIAINLQVQGVALEDLQKEDVIQALFSPEYELMERHLKIIFSHLPPKTVSDILEEGLKRGLTLEDPTTHELTPILNLKIFELFSLEELLQHKEIQLEDFATGLSNAYDMLKDSFYLNKMANERVIKQIYTKVSTFIFRLMDLFLSIWFRYADILTGMSLTTKEQRKQGAGGLDWPLKLLWSLFAFMTLCQKMIDAGWFGEQEIVNKVLAWASLLVVLLIVISPLIVWIKSHFDSLPESVEGFTNLNTMAEQGEFNHLIDFDTDVRKLVEGLGRGKGVWLKGASGTSKDLIVKAFARQVALGKVVQYGDSGTKLANVTIFEVNLEEQRGTAKEVLEQFLREVGPFSQEVVVFINHAELAKADQKRARALAALQAHFPYSILGVPEGFRMGSSYEDKMAQVSYDPLPVGASDEVKGRLKYQLKAALRNHQRKIAPGHDDIPEPLLELIIQLSGAIEGRLYQPARALALLGELLNEEGDIGNLERLDQQRNVAMATAQIVLDFENMGGRNEATQAIENVVHTRDSLIPIERELRTQAEKVHRLEAVRELRWRVRRYMNATAILAYADGRERTPNYDLYARRRMILEDFLLPILEEVQGQMHEETKAWTQHEEITEEKIRRAALKLFQTEATNLFSSYRQVV